MQLVRNAQAVRGRPFVLTTTNKAALEKLVGPAEVSELVGKPYDFEEVVRRVRAVFDGRPAG